MLSCLNVFEQHWYLILMLDYSFISYPDPDGSGFFSPFRIRILKTRIRILKTRIRIRPSFAFNIFNNLMMLFDEILEDPNQKKIVLRVIKQIFLLVLLAFGGFFMYPDPDFLNPIQIFLPNRIRTREKKSDLDPDKRTRIRNTATKQTGTYPR